MSRKVTDVVSEMDKNGVETETYLMMLQRSLQCDATEKAQSDGGPGRLTWQSLCEKEQN